MSAGAGREFRAAAGWIALFDELAAWQDAGRRAQFWWRDDDARRPSQPLHRLLELSALHGTPLLLAVIPEGSEPALAEAIAESGAPVAFAQHGIGHHDNAPKGTKKTELHDRMLDEPTFAPGLKAGKTHLESLFPDRFLPVMVPPWNRIGPGVEALLPDLGYAGLSTDGPAAASGAAAANGPAAAANGLRRVNTHVDLVDWRADKRFIGAERALRAVTEALSRRRAEGRNEPVGLLTHHLVHDRALWTFLAQFLALMAGHPAAEWPHPAALFG